MSKSILKKIIGSLMLVTIFSLNGFSQMETKSAIPAVDKSPLDESFYPANYPLLKLKGTVSEPLRARVIYSRPQVNNREIFGKLVDYDKVWRLGANEATDIEFFTDAVINNVKIKKGRYSLFVIPTIDKWTFILSKQTDVWGSFKYNAAEDVVRKEVPVKSITEPVEYFSLYFQASSNGCNLIASWDKVEAALPISF